MPLKLYCPIIDAFHTFRHSSDIRETVLGEPHTWHLPVPVTRVVPLPVSVVSMAVSLSLPLPVTTIPVIAIAGYSIGGGSVGYSVGRRSSGEIASPAIYRVISLPIRLVAVPFSLLFPSVVARSVIGIAGCGVRRCSSGEVASPAVSRVVSLPVGLISVAISLLLPFSVTARTVIAIAGYSIHSGSRSNGILHWQSHC
jgi:hypothetical protein